MALTALPLSGVESVRSQGGGLARWAWRRWQERFHRLLVTLLVANNAVHISLPRTLGGAPRRPGSQDESRKSTRFFARSVRSK
jgi:hypothetical protein